MWAGSGCHRAGMLRDEPLHRSRVAQTLRRGDGGNQCDESDRLHPHQVEPAPAPDPHARRDAVRNGNRSGPRSWVYEFLAVGQFEAVGRRAENMTALVLEAAERIVLLLSGVGHRRTHRPNCAREAVVRAKCNRGLAHYYVLTSLMNGAQAASARCVSCQGRPGELLHGCGSSACGSDAGRRRFCGHWYPSKLGQNRGSNG